MNRPAEAVPHLEAAIRAAASSAQLELNLGAALAFSGRIDEGVQHYRRALELNPRSAEAYNNLGAVELAYGRFESAAHYFQEALALAPTDAGYLRNLHRARAMAKAPPPNLVSSVPTCAFPAAARRANPEGCSLAPVLLGAGPWKVTS